MTRAAPEADAIALAERILVLVDEGARTATYKLAVLAGLMDLCLEKTTTDGRAPDTLTTRELAEKVIALYWPQTRAATDAGRSTVLRQNTRGQAEIVARIAEFRASVAADPGCPLARARRQEPVRWLGLVHFVEWKLIEMPLPKLQRIGGVRDEMLYEIGWDDGDLQPSRAEVTAYQEERESPFDNRVRLRPGVGDALVRLHGLLRPILESKWARMVAEVNDLEEARLHRFLFGARRESLDPVRAPLLELHDGCCFYCARKIAIRDPRAVAVDHFVPWSRHPDDAVENLVPAHERCNSQKRDFLAARQHVRAWHGRNLRHRADLADIAERARFDHDPERVLGVARGIYTRLPVQARLWLRGDEFEPVGAQPFEPLFAQELAGAT